MILEHHGELANPRLRGSLSKRRCQWSFNSYGRSNGGSDAATRDVSDENRVTTAYGSVATSCDSITMNGTLKRRDVYSATSRYHVDIAVFQLLRELHRRRRYGADRAFRRVDAQMVEDRR
jgi:hypothetical protein